MSEYHKSVKQSSEKSDQQGLFIQQLTMLDIQEAVKGRFTSFCTAIGIQALMTMSVPPGTPVYARICWQI